MASYRLVIKPSASKELEGLPKQDRKRVVARIEGLAKVPRPVGCEKLSGNEQYRLRQGNYRILYSIDDNILIVAVVKIGHRKDVYR